MKSLVFLFTLLIGGINAYANSSTVADDGSAGTPAAAQVAPTGSNRADGGKAETEASGLASIEPECLKEGESCNQLTDRCCPGLSCQGGLAAICARKQ